MASRFLRNVPSVLLSLPTLPPVRSSKGEIYRTLSPVGCLGGGESKHTFLPPPSWSPVTPCDVTWVLLLFLTSLRWLRPSSGPGRARGRGRRRRRGSGRPQRSPPSRRGGRILSPVTIRKKRCCSCCCSCSCCCCCCSCSCSCLIVVKKIIWSPLWCFRSA